MGHLELEHVQHAQIEIVKKWARIQDISNTSIALPAYMMMDLITALLVGVLVSVVRVCGRPPPPPPPPLLRERSA